jgi:hypothetical protein
VLDFVRPLLTDEEDIKEMMVNRDWIKPGKKEGRTM